MRHYLVAAAMLRPWLSCSYLFSLAAQGLSSPVRSREGLVAVLALSTARDHGLQTIHRRGHSQLKMST